MTSPALVVLTLALVCSTYGTATEQTADRASEHAMHIKPEAFDPNASNRMGTRTKFNSNIDNKQVDNIYNLNRKINIIEDNIHTENQDVATVFKKLKGTNLDTEAKYKFRKQLRVTHTFEDSSKNLLNIKMHQKGFKEKKVNKSNVKQIKQVDFNNNYTDSAEEEFVATREPHFRQIEYRKFVHHNKYEEPESVYNDIKYINFGEEGLRNFRPDVELKGRLLNSRMSDLTHLKRVKRQEADTKFKEKKCEEFALNTMKTIYHPHDSSIPTSNYYSNIECVLVLRAKEGEVIKLTFVDHFHIEYHPKCTYDYLEIRDGEYGYAEPFGRFCGETFPQQLISTGPSMWLKFRADETIEYEGFTIKVENVTSTTSHKIPEACYKDLTGPTGTIDSAAIDPECISGSASHALDVLWTIKTAAGTDIYLNFTLFELAKPNECEENVIQVFGYIMEEEKNLAHYCGSAANSVTTRLEGKPTVNGNIMHVHLFLSQSAAKATKMKATFTAFRTLDPTKEESCLQDEEFNCEDNTCIALKLKCDSYAHCRLKADEDPETCRNVQESLIGQPHILVILVIFSLILSGMSFVFLFKCIRKLYQDHKAIKEHIRQSTEDRLDTIITGSRLILDPKSLRDQPRASLERENHTNELFKQQRSISQHKRIPKQTSIESDFQETHLDLDGEPWRRDVDSVPEAQDVKVERNGRTRRHDTSRKEETLRSRKESIEEKKEIRDAAVGAPDTKESGCQTRESLFQADTALSSDGSNSAGNSRGFSTFGYSGATLVRPSPPPAPPAPTPMISSAQIELLRQLPSLDTGHKTQKKISDRRPMSAETTRSAPDVIIVSKPIR